MNNSVEKTVKPTYRALADNDLKLVEALKKDYIGKS